MKLRNLVAAVLVVVTTLSVRSQEGFYYQAVIRNADGSPIKNTQTTLTLSLLDTETVVYSEQHTL
jgi:alpha-D-ribose 1-methylphosphonate 5-triphosphate synthase subunit PhnH